MPGSLEQFLRAEPLRIAAEVLQAALPERPRSAGAIARERWQVSYRKHVSSASNAGEDQALGLQLGVGAFHGDADDAQIVRQLAAGWQARIRGQIAG